MPFCVKKVNQEKLTQMLLALGSQGLILFWAGAELQWRRVGLCVSKLVLAQGISVLASPFMQLEVLSDGSNLCIDTGCLTDLTPVEDSYGRSEMTCHRHAPSSRNVSGTQSQGSPTAEVHQPELSLCHRNSLLSICSWTMAPLCHSEFLANCPLIGEGGFSLAPAHCPSLMDIRKTTGNTELIGSNCSSAISVAMLPLFQWVSQSIEWKVVFLQESLTSITFTGTKFTG